MPEEIKIENSWRLPVLVAVFIFGSAAMMYAQFLTHARPWLHHSIFCAGIVVAATFAARQAKGKRITKAGVIYSAIGLTLSVGEGLMMLYHHFMH